MGGWGKRIISCETVQLQFRPPWSLSADLLGKELIHPARSAQKLHLNSSKTKESFFWWKILNAAKTHFVKQGAEGVS